MPYPKLLEFPGEYSFDEESGLFRMRAFIRASAPDERSVAARFVSRPSTWEIDQLRRAEAYAHFEEFRARRGQVIKFGPA